MIKQLQQDATEAPQAFDWAGPVKAAELDSWVASSLTQIPAELKRLWAATGGGDMFETEELLSPGADGTYNLDLRNAELQRAGLPPELLVFHDGLYLSAIDRAGSIVALDPKTLSITRSFPSLDHWYNDIRTEYGETYGLTSPRDRR